MKLSESTTKMELCDIQSQYEMDKDVPVLVRNLLAYLENRGTSVKRLSEYNISLYQPSNKNVPYSRWYDIDDLKKVVSVMTKLPEFICETELYRACSWEYSSENKIPISIRKFTFIKATKKTRIMLRSRVSSEHMYRRHPKTQKVEMIPEQAVKEQLLELHDLKGE